MRCSFALMTCFLICGVSSVFSEEAGPPQAIVVSPNQVQLMSSRWHQRLLVSAQWADKTTADVTATAHFTSSDPGIVRVEAGGVLLPVSDGTAEVVVQWKEHQTRVGVSVTGTQVHAPVDFATEVIGALSRGGCNQGACHGSPQGKNGFRLSLRGFEPALDFRFLTRDSFSRRINPLEPEKSLALQKATGVVAHQGGVQLRADEEAYQQIRTWISELGSRPPDGPDMSRQLQILEVLPGRQRLHASGPKQQLVVRAHYSDGMVRDVTDLAVFTTPSEPEVTVSRGGLVEFHATGEAAVLVRYLDQIQTVRMTYIRQDPDFEFVAPPESNYVDRHVFAKQRELQLRPAQKATDAVFLRRVYLDLVGAIPGPVAARAFLESRDPQKRSKLIDQLLESDAYSQFWALKWADVMRGNREAISERGVHNFHRFLVRNFAADRSFDVVAREIVTSVGNTINAPAANFYRISRTPNEAAESFSQLFLGVRIQCAKCHNHPFESITQGDYYGLAAHFARVQLKGRRFGRDDEIVFLQPTGEIKMPGVEEDMAPAAFGTQTVELKSADDRRIGLADWLTDPSNRFFARSTVNRIWFHLMGQGIVEPVDDFRDSNPPSSHELLDGLSEKFIEYGFRFKPIIRDILNSTTYQLSPRSVPEQSPRAANPARYFTGPIVRMLSAEQIIDAISAATGVPEVFPGYPQGTRAVSIAEGKIEHKFLQAFTRPSRDVACDCAREEEPSLNQVVHLLNNASILAKIDSAQNRTARWLDQKLDVDAVIIEIYLATVTRKPTAAEQQLARRYVDESKVVADGLQDLQHALINSNEFLLRH